MVIRQGGGEMAGHAIAEKDRRMAEKCLICPACKKARKKQKGLFFLFVKFIEGWACPHCLAYEKVYGRKAHEIIPGDT